jgi:hypothetical protein
MPKTFVSSVPYVGERIFAAAVYCSDGRIGDQVDDFLHHGLGLPRYDRVACPGGPVLLSGRAAGYWDAQGVEHQLRFLGQVHDIRTVVLIAHEGCAYYLRRLAIAAESVQAEQRDDLQRATMAVSRAVPRASVLRYFARHSGDGISFEGV